MRAEYELRGGRRNPYARRIGARDREMLLERYLRAEERMRPKRSASVRGKNPRRARRVPKTSFHSVRRSPHLSSRRRDAERR